MLNRVRGFAAKCTQLGLVILLAAFSSSVWAYSVWMPTGKVYNAKAITHVAVVGYSHGQGNQFVQTAAARLARYAELYPDRNFVLYQPKSEVFALSGLTRSKLTSDELLGETLVQELLTHTRIATLDFFSHSSVHQGVGLELTGVNRPDQSFYAVGLPNNPVVKFRSGTPGLEKLKKVLLPEAWITLNGCNAGWIQAPALSKIVERPVLAALTGTDFQRLHQDDNYYFNNEGSYPADKKWAKENTIAYDKSKACSSGACLRMKPQGGAYKGFWGNYQNIGALGYYKFFCSYKDADKTCYKAMGRYLMSVLSTRPLSASSQRADYVETIYDMVCPISPTKPRRADCVAALDQKLKTGDEVYAPYAGISADCSLTGCKIKSVTCDFQKTGVGVPGTCKFVPVPGADGSRTLIREVKNYLRGLDELGIK